MTGLVDSIVDYVSIKGWEAKRFGRGIIDSQGEMHVKICPYCRNEKFNFSLNTILDGYPYKCWACGASGNMRSLMRDQGDDHMVPPAPEGASWKRSQSTLVAPAFARRKDYKSFSVEWAEKCHQRMLENAGNALEQMRSRGLTDDTVRQFRIGVSIAARGGRERQPWWVFPYIEGGAVRLIKYRTVPPAPKHMAREEGMESVLFNWDNVNKNDNTIILAEGEIDAMSIWQSGHTNVVAVSIGANNFRPEWVVQLEQFERVILVFDQDDAGRKGTQEAIRRLGEDRVFTVELPEGMDANDVLARDGDEALRAAIDKAKPVPLQDVVHVTQAIERLMERMLETGSLENSYPWMFNGMDEAVGRVREAQYWVVCGTRGCGKSTLMRQQSLEWAKQRIPVLYWCGEMSVEQTTKTIIQCTYGLRDEEIDERILSMAFRDLPEMTLYFGMQTIDPNIKAVLAMCLQAYRRYGVKVFVLDNLGLLTQGCKDPTMEEGRVAQALNNFAIYYNVTMFLIVHPRKRDSYESQGKIDNIDDVKGNGNVTNFAAQAFTMWRKQTMPKDEKELFDNPNVEVMDRRTVIIPLKARYGGGKGKVWLYLDGEKSQFREATERDFREE